MKKKDIKINYKSGAEPRTMAGEVPVFCSHDEMLPLEKIIPNPKNPNHHPESQIKLLAEIIKAQGWRQPITISNRSGFVVKGHGRLAAAKLAGIPEAPVDHQNYASEAEEYADLMADNRLAELSEMDNTMLADLLTEMDTGEIPIELSGYTEEDLEGILDAIAGIDDAEPDDIDNEQESFTTPLTRPGDLWELGLHRLIIGDATKPEVVDRLMNGETAAMVHTDPPYGVSYNGGAGTLQKDGSRKSKWEQETWDTYEDDDFINRLLIPAFNNYRKHTTKNAAFYIWHGNNSRKVFENAMERAGLIERQYLIWYKDKITLGHTDYQMAHEPCFYASKDGEKPKFYGDRKQESVLTVTSRHDGTMDTVIGNGLVLTDGVGGKLYISRNQPKGKKVRYIRMDADKPIHLYDEDKMATVWQAKKEQAPLHPTQKPVELPIRAIENSSEPGDIVMDLFGGSGSTLLAAEKTGRRCYTTEIDPAFGDVIISRYLIETGNIGIKCVRDGKTYDYIDMIRQWAKENGKEEELKGNKIPIVVVKKIQPSIQQEEPEE